MRPAQYYRDKARELFLSGYNCSQAVIAAFAEDFDISTNTAMALASPFGAGLSGMREMCGAVSGMAMAAGLIFGQSAPMSQKQKSELYARIRSLADSFRENNGSCICRELLSRSGVAFSSTPQERTPEYYKKRPCPELCADAAGILAQYLAETRN